MSEVMQRGVGHQLMLLHAVQNLVIPADETEQVIGSMMSFTIC
jgi:hypothetical protein